MPSAPLRTSPQAAAASRDRGDACPGALRLHSAHDGALARVRVPGGVLGLRQARALGDAARELGDGELHLTSRGNVQLRGLADTCGADLAAALTAAGLLPSPAHERVRNVVASPLSGLDGAGLRDVRPWLVALDAALCASDAARELSGRFLFALDDGRADVAGLGADVTLRATADGGALLGLGAGGEALRVSGEDAPRAALIAAETFLEVARTSGTNAWRVRELALSEGALLDRVRDALSAGGVDCARQPLDPVGAARVPAPGVTGDTLAVHAPLGRLTAPQWRELTSVAAGSPLGELRLTPWRGVVVPVPGLDSAGASQALGRLGATGLVTDADSPWLRVGACIGRPGCAKSLADVRADAARALPEATPGGLPLYWSGCARRCGHPPGDRIDAVAVADGGYRLSAAGPGRDDGGAVALDDPARLEAALAAITP
ncbi:precorrin-3B synthase [Streptomyces sp. G45]|uniref:precorrin-3B synthase n=1 Tax=Streptomyces sp. G45 TaxID=3406627 RepID=UPI003C173E07